MRFATLDQAALGGSRLRWTAAVLGLLVAAATAQDVPAYRDPQRPVDERVPDFLGTSSADDDLQSVILTVTAE